MPAWITSLLRELVWLPMQPLPLEHHHLAPGARQAARHREPDDARPDHHAPDPVHRRTPPCPPPLCRGFHYPSNRRGRRATNPGVTGAPH